MVERWIRVIGCKKPGIVWSWFEGRFGGRERVSSKEEVGSEEIDGYETGEEERSEEYINNGSVTAGDGSGGRCIARA